MRLFLQKMYQMLCKSFTNSAKVSTIKNEKMDAVSFINMKIHSQIYRFRVNAFAVLTLVLLFGANEMKGQIIAPSESYTQNFDAIGTTATASLPAGWVAEKITGARTITAAYTAVTGTATTLSNAYNVAMGSTAGNGIYNFGNATASDRSVGGLSSSSASQSVNMFLKLTNSSITSSIPSFSISYKAKRFRNGTNTAGFSIRLYYSTTGAANSWTEITAGALGFTANADNIGSITNPLETKTASNVALAQSLAAGGTIYFAWSYSVSSGTTTSNAQALGIDDVSINAVSSTPTISTTGTLSAVNTNYGSTSASPTSISVSGSGLTAGILVTPPAGYEVSLTSGSGYGSTVTVGSSGTIASTPVYVRLTSTATVVGSPYSGDIVLSSSGATSVNVATVSSTVSAKVLTISGLSANNKVYDGNTSATLSGTAALVGVVNSDVVTLGGTPVATFASSAAGTGIAVTVTGYSFSGAGSGNYTLTQPTGLTADITSTPTPIISSTLTASETYGTIASTYTITASESPISYNATGLPAGLSINTTNGQITGTPTEVPGNYNVTISATNAAGTGSATLVYTISPKNLTVSGALADNKIYDRTTSATISGSTLVGIVGADVVTISGTGSFSAATVGNGIVVTSSQTLGGADAAKYTVTLPSGLAADITAKALTIASAAAANKIFDGTNTATITGTLTGVIAPDEVTVALTGTFASTTVANGIVVTSTSTIGGANSGNYNLTQPTGLTANITAVPATLLQWNTTGNLGTETTEPSTTNNANVAAASLNYTGSIVEPTGNSNRFGAKNWAVGPLDTTKYIQFTVTPNAGYSFTATSLDFIWEFSGTGPKSVTIRSSIDNYTANLGSLTNMTSSPSVVKNIAFSGITNITTATTFRIYGYDATALTGTGGFDTVASATTNNVILNGTTQFNQTPTITGVATLTPFTTTYGTASAIQTVAISASNLTNDLVATAPTGFEVSYNGTSWGPTATFIQTSGTTSGTLSIRLSANATVSGTYNSNTIVLSSTAAASVNIITTTTGNIVSPLALSITGLTGVSKVYDGILTAAFNGTATYSGLVNGDPFTSVSGTPSASFVDKTVGIAKPVIVTGFTAPSSNYTISQPTGLTADITAAPLTITGAAVTTKTYNGSASATITGILSGIVGSDVVTFASGTSAFASANPGSGIAVTAGCTLSGADASNYILTQPTGLTGTISAILSPTISVSPTATANFTTTYGTASASQSFAVTGSSLSNDITVTAASGFEVSIDNSTFGSSVTFSPSSGSISATIYVRLAATNSVTGSYNNITSATLTSTGATSVSLTTPSTGNSVTAKALTITGITAVNKVYNGILTAAFNGTASYVGLVNGESFTVIGTPSASFDTKTVGTGKSITVSGYVAPSSNYSVSQPTGLTADITPATLTISNASVTNRVYNGTTSASITGTLTGVVSGDVVTFDSGTSAFASADAGTGIAVNAGCLLSGADSSNYTLTQPSGLTGTISLANQTITGLPTSGTKSTSDVPYVLSATASSGLPVTYTSSNTAVATVSGSTITIIGVGTTTITASQDGNSNYNAATSITQTLTVAALPSVLAAGDIAVVSINSKDPDTFKVVLLKAINAGTVINFTDNGFTGTDTTGRTGEGFLTFTAPTALPYGTILTWTNLMTITGTGWSSNAPSSFAFANAGDQLFVFQGSTANWTSQNGITLLFGLNYGVALNSTSASANTIQPNTSILPSTAFLNLGTATNANGYYSGTGAASTAVTLCGSPATILSNVITPAKWLGTTAAVATFPAYTVSAICPPTVVTTGTFTAFTTIYGTASAVQTVAVSASNLTNDVVATAPTGFEVSYNGTSWGSTATFVQTSGTASGTLSIRLSANATVSGLYNSQNIVLSSTGATSVNIATTTIGNIVSPLALSITGLTADSKIYDGTTAATLSGTPTYSGLVNGDTFATVTGTPLAIFNTKNVGTGKTITISGYTAPSTNYTITQPTTSADITAKDLTVTSIVANDKVYDGNNITTVSATLNGVVNPDNVTLASSGVFTVFETGSPTYIGNFGVTASFTLNGTDSINYNLIQPNTSGLTASITPKALTISNPIAYNKVYDGTTVAVVSGTLVGVISTTSDVVTLNGSYGTFASSGVGTNIVVTPTWVIDGDTYNYTLIQPTNILSANITSPGSPTITSTVVASANYGATSTSYSITTNINATSYSASGLPDGLSINTATGEITGAPTTAGTFNVTLGANGVGGTGYATLVYTISPITLTVSGATANNKAYDGTTTATINGTLVGVINSDDVSFNGVGTFDSFNVASNIAVTSNATLTGTKASNYLLENPTGLVANITPKELTFTASVSDKVYDRTNLASVTLTSINGIVGTDVVTATLSGTFDTVSAGNNKPVSITSLTLGGANAANYSVVTPTTVTGNITQKPITVTAIANDKVFDGTDVATIIVSATVGVISPDVVTVTGGGTFASTAIGNTISVSPSLVLGGADANNYTLTQPSGLTANILVVPTVLNAGDIAIIGYNTGGTPDNFTILVLKDLISGTQFFVSDNEVATAGGTTFTDLNEGEASFTVKAGQSIAAGTVIVLPCGTAVSTTTYDWPASGLNLTNSDDLYIYTAPSVTATTPTQFIYLTKIGTSTSAVPNGLTLGYSSIASSAPAARYSTTGNIYNSCKSILLTEIGKTTTSNWTTIGATALASSDWTFTVLPTCPSPTINASGILAGLTTIYGTASAITTSFSLNGSYLTNSITINAPSGFEVSTNASSGFASSITVSQISGSVASTIIYVRISATATVINSPYSGDIVCTSTGATTINVATASSTVTPKTVSISGILVNNKIQTIGDFTATLSGTPVLNGVLNLDVANVTLGGTPIANFSQDTAGENIPVIVSGYILNGTAAVNYTLTQPSLTGTITSVASPVITSALTFSSVYGTIASSYTITATTDPSYPITAYSATGLPSGLTVNTVTGEISGTPTVIPGIYNATISATNAGGTTNAYLIYTITAKTLTVSGATASSKVYNGTTAATIIGYSLNGIYGSDVVTALGTGLFSDKNVGTGIAVSATMTLSGSDATKYTLIQPTGLTADITPLTLTLSGVSAQNKVVDGTNLATINATLVGVITGDTVTFNGTGTFASPNVGQGIAVTSTSTLSGTDAGNYTFVQPTNLTANITEKVLYYNVFTGANVCPTNGNIPTMATNSTGTPVTRSTVTCNATANVFNSTTISTSASLNPASYIEFSVSAAAGYQLNLKSLSFFRQVSSTAPNKMEVRYSNDNFVTYTTWGAAPNSPTTGTVATWDFADFSTTVSNTVTFRIYPYGTQRADNTASSTSGTFRVDDVTVYGTVSSVAPNTANLKLNIEGYYNATTQSMIPVKANQLVAGATSTDVDDITVELRSNNGILVDTAVAALKTNGTAVATFPNTAAGSYYLVIKYKNAIETWSATPQLVGPISLTYDFTTAASKAYGNNMKQVSPGVYAIYSGDINQDANIDNLDYSTWEEDANIFTSGYFATDLNGDGNVDNLDYSIWETNSNNFVYSISPF